MNTEMSSTHRLRLSALPGTFLTVALLGAAVLTVFSALEEPTPLVVVDTGTQVLEIDYLDLAKAERSRGLRLLNAGKYDESVIALCDAKLLRDASEDRDMLADIEELLNISVIVADEKMGRPIRMHHFVTRRHQWWGVDEEAHRRMRADELTTRARILMNQREYEAAREAAHRATCFSSLVDVEYYEDLITISKSLDADVDEAARRAAVRRAGESR